MKQSAGDKEAAAYLQLPKSTIRPESTGRERTADFFKRFYESAGNGSVIEAETITPENLALAFAQEGIQSQDAIEYYRMLEKARGEILVPRNHPAGIESPETKGLGYSLGGSMKDTLRMDKEMQAMAQIFGFDYKPMRPATAADEAKAKALNDQMQINSALPTPMISM